VLVSSSSSAVASLFPTNWVRLRAVDGEIAWGRFLFDDAAELEMVWEVLPFLVGSLCAITPQGRNFILSTVGWAGGLRRMLRRCGYTERYIVDSPPRFRYKRTETPR
jgi:hypothetical protein